MRKLWNTILSFFDISRVNSLVDRSNNVVNVFKQTADELQQINNDIANTQSDYETEMQLIQERMITLEHQFVLNAIVARKIKEFLSDDEED